MKGKVWEGKNTFHRKAACADNTLQSKNADLISIDKAINRNLIPCGICMTCSKHIMRRQAILYGISWKEALAKMEWSG